MRRGLYSRSSAAAALLLVAAAALLVPGCASRWQAAEARTQAPLPRGTLPESLATREIAVLPFANATGQALRVPQGLLGEAKRAVGAAGDDPGVTVPQLLAQRAGAELARRGFATAPPERVDALLGGSGTAGEASAPADPKAAAQRALQAGIQDPVLMGVLRRFTVTQSGLLLVRLELAIVEPRSEEVVWTGSAARPVPIPSALTWQEILLDAGPAIFAEAFGSGR